MVLVRLANEEIRLEPEEWNLWLQDGRIPPDATVRIEGTGWVPVASLPEYRRTREDEVRPGPRVPEVFPVVFPRRGLSATEAFGLANLLAAGILTAILGAGYLDQIGNWATHAWFQVRDHHAYGYWIPTLFLHAGPKHLASNMVSLIATAGAVEYLMGRRWVYALYFVTGIAGMWLSFAGHGRPPLSIGASGAIFGLGGAVVTFVLRRYRSFSYRQRWKARRVYAPLFVVLILPSVLNADYLGHLGGLIAGLCAGLFIPPHPRLRLGGKKKAPSEEGANERSGIDSV